MTEQNHEMDLGRLLRLANILDASIKVPYTRFKVGLDAIIGLIPVVGDFVTFTLSLWIVFRAVRMGVKSKTVLLMLWNLVLDLVIGMVPVLGDIFDAFWKSNLRNVDLLKNDLANNIKEVKNS